MAFISENPAPAKEPVCEQTFSNQKLAKSSDEIPLPNFRRALPVSSAYSVSSLPPGVMFTKSDTEPYVLLICSADIPSTGLPKASPTAKPAIAPCARSRMVIIWMNNLFDLKIFSRVHLRSFSRVPNP